MLDKLDNNIVDTEARRTAADAQFGSMPLNQAMEPMFLSLYESDPGARSAGLKKSAVEAVEAKLSEMIQGESFLAPLTRADLKN